MSESDKIMMFKTRQTLISQRSSVKRNSLQTNCPRFIEKNEWHPELSRFEPAGLSRLGFMLELKKYHKVQHKPKTTDELEVALQTIWEELSQEHV